MLLDSRIIINSEYCTGCGLCELVCSVVQERQWHPSLSRIRIITDTASNLYMPLCCMHCQNAPCILSCLMNVIYRDKNGLVLRDEDGCIGCRACEVSCPFTAARFQHQREVVITCNLCAGGPSCVDHCPTGALQFLPAGEALERKRTETARLRIVEMPITGSNTGVSE